MERDSYRVGVKVTQRVRVGERYSVGDAGRI